ncbi:MAG: histidine kinase [Bacteroidota bacterium]
MKSGLRHIFFWIAYLFYDTISTGSILDDFNLAFSRSFIHGILLAAMVYLNLWVLYPIYFKQRKIPQYILYSFLLVSLTFALRLQIDVVMSNYTFDEEYESQIYDPTRQILENLIEVELYPSYTYQLDSLLVQRGQAPNTQEINEAIVARKEAVVQQCLKAKPYSRIWEYGSFYLIGMFLGTGIVYAIFSTLKLVQDSYLRFEHQRKYLRAENLRLRTQLNQHFLFNALTSIHHRFQTIEDAEGKEMTQDLKWMIQYAIEKCEKSEFVSLHDELLMAEKYLGFHSQRRGNIQFPAPRNEHLEIALMPMLINPILENAIKHGNLYKEEAFIQFDIKVQDEFLHLEMTNSFEAAKNTFAFPLRTGFGIGLKNLENRLRLFYQEVGEYELNYGEDEAEKVFKVQIKLPYVEMKLTD